MKVGLNSLPEQASSVSAFVSSLSWLFCACRLHEVLHSQQGGCDLLQTSSVSYAACLLCITFVCGISVMWLTDSVGMSAEQVWGCFSLPCPV